MGMWPSGCCCGRGFKARSKDCGAAAATWAAGAAAARMTGAATVTDILVAGRAGCGSGVAGADGLTAAVSWGEDGRGAAATAGAPLLTGAGAGAGSGGAARVGGACTCICAAAGLGTGATAVLLGANACPREPLVSACTCLLEAGEGAAAPMAACAGRDLAGYSTGEGEAGVPDIPGAGSAAGKGSGGGGGTVYGGSGTAGHADLAA